MRRFPILATLLVACAVVACLLVALPSDSLHYAFAALPLHGGISVASFMAPIVNTRGRGIIGVRNEGQVPAIFEELKRTVEEFKASHEEELKGIKNKFADVVSTEKVERINAEITKLQKSLDDCNALIAALKIGGAGGDGINPAQKEHADAFNKWFRKGVDNGLSDLEVKASLTTQSNPDGGYLVPVETETTINRVLGLVSAMRQLATVMPIGTGVYRKFVNQGGAGAGWVSEEAARPETGTPSLKELIFNVMEMYANPATTQQMLDDGIIDIAAWIADEVSIKFAEIEGTAFVSGSGVAQPRGILSYPIIANASYAWGSVGYVPSGGAAGFAASAPADALIDLFYSLKQGYRNGASFLTSDPVLGTIRKMKDGQGNYLWRAPDQQSGVPTILEKPVYTDDNMPAIASNVFPVAFANFKQAYLILDRVGIRVLRDPYTNKPKVMFYTTKRVGGGVANFEAIKLLKMATS